MSRRSDKNKYYEPDIDPRDMLKGVKRAIYELSVGMVKSYTLGKATFTYYNLSELRSLKKELEQEIAQSETPSDLIGSSYAAYFDRR